MAWIVRVSTIQERRVITYEVANENAGQTDAKNIVQKGFHAEDGLNIYYPASQICKVEVKEI